MIFGIAGAHGTTSLPAETVKTLARAGQLFTVETLCVVLRCVALRSVVWRCVAPGGRRGTASAAAAISGRARAVRAKGIRVSVK